MILLIDGYNVLKLIYPHIKGPLEKQRNLFIQELGLYNKKKDSKLKEIIIVFDGGLFNHATREIKHSITVIFSGKKQSADDWIIDFVQRKKQEEITLVTMDRKLIELCKRQTIATLESEAFYIIMQSVILNNITTGHHIPLPTQSPTIQKYTTQDTEYLDAMPQSIDQQGLDLLMEQASLSIPPEKYQEQAPSSTIHKKSPALSKKEKKIYTTIKKLY
ncbi:MAG: hypothetical protein US69_C0002G0044 [candidate division TM6 bacterium GW2011_GWF2_38_10]|nr:MAG: hypothetical protein US69_C0002G0044 [candidate division TM6 bacterium GW2011_GWF2_38_10]